MASKAQQETQSGWRRFVSNLTAFAEAAEMDGVSYLEMRMKLLERRIARLEGTRPDDADITEVN